MFTTSTIITAIVGGAILTFSAYLAVIAALIALTFIAWAITAPIYSWLNRTRQAEFKDWGQS